MKFEENNCKEFKKQFNDCFIYFLVREEHVVYVGRTQKNIFGIYSNLSNKIFDSVYILECDEQNLNYYQDIYIKKYLPIYNNSMNMAMNMSLSKARDLLKEKYEGFNLRHLKKLIQVLNIPIILFNGKQTISNTDYIKICELLQEEVK